MPAADLFSLIIVDDEPAILEGLEKTFDWESFGFSVVATAPSAEKALSLIQVKKPDVVMTDIKMRKMDGLELIRQAKLIDRGLSFVIVSAHDDFSYAQEACNLGVYSYMVKPIDEEQLHEVMSRLYEQCRLAKSREIKLDQFASFVTERRHELEELLYRKFLTSEIAEGELARQLRAIGSTQVSTQVFCSICFDTNISGRILSDVDADTHQFVVTRYLLEKLAAHYTTWTIDLPDGRAAAVVAEKQYSDRSEAVLRDLLKKMVTETSGESVPDLAFAVGGFFHGLAGMAKSHLRALDSIGYQLSIGTKAHEGEKENLPRAPGNYTYPRGEAAEIIRGIRLSDQEHVTVHVSAFDACLTTLIVKVRALHYRRLANDISLFYYEMGFLAESSLEKLGRFVENAEKLPGAEMPGVLLEIIGDLLEQQQRYYLSQTEGRYDQRVKEAMLYIDSHLDIEHLSAGDVASEVFLNTAYFGRLFRKCAGVSFNEYVNQRRMESAAEMLNATDLPVQEISIQVGIPNPSYFSTLFKRQMGMSPREYRMPNR